jgi:hypothetical protein
VTEPAHMDTRLHFFPREILFKPFVAVDRARDEMVKVVGCVALTKFAGGHLPVFRLVPMT